MNPAISKLFEWEYEKKAKFYCDDINSDLLKVKLKTLRSVISVQIDVVNTFTDIQKLVQQHKMPLRCVVCLLTNWEPNWLNSAVVLIVYEKLLNELSFLDLADDSFIAVIIGKLCGVFSML